jgi:hypothetical protein
MTGIENPENSDLETDRGQFSADGLQSSGGDAPADNIRDEQQTHAGGAVPPAYVGSAEPEGDNAPEEALGHPEEWDSQG